MKYKIVASIAAILSFLNGVFFVFAPALALSLMGRDSNMTGIMSTRFFGACAFGLAIISWLARNVKYPEVQRWVSSGMIITLGFLAAIDLDGILTGAMNYLGWIMFAADFLLCLGFIISVFTDGGQRS